MAAHQAPPSLGFSRQEHWTGLPVPSPMGESGKWKVKLKALSCVWLFVTAWTAASQAPLSMGFSRKEYWSGVPLPSTHFSGSDRIPVELFQILKDDAVKVLHSICQKIWKTQQWPQDWKRSVFIPIPKKGNPKECSNYCTIALISHASKVMLKILQARLQQYVNRELPDVQVSFRKAEEPEIKLSTSTGSSKKQKSSRKTFPSPGDLPHPGIKPGFPTL